MQRLLIRLAILLTSMGASVLCAQTSAFVMVNAASYGAAPAPDSLATIFGTGLAQATASAVLDAAGQLPIELAATRVEISGVAARLIYVSPGQINLVVPGGTVAGTVDVVIRPTGSGTPKTATTSIRTAAPGVFTTDASGAGPGAILNAVTYTPAPFLVQTGSGNGSDTRTRLAVYGTGFRHATLVTANAQDASGKRYTLKVEYADAAPGFIGLDQVNLLLPPDLDGAGAVSLSLGADGIPANPVTFRMNLLAASALQLASLTVSPALLSAGDSATVTVGLNGVARAGGFFVALHSSGAAAQVAAQVTIPAGTASAQTTLTTLTVAAPVNPTITAQAGGASETASIEIDPASTVQLASVSVSSTSIVGGRNLTGTVTLTGNAPAGGVNVLLASDNDSVPAPPPVTVPFGKSSADFAIATLAVNAPQPVTLTATLSRTSATARLTLLPPIQLTLDTSSVTGGNSVTGTVTLGDPAPITGATIQIQSGDGSVASPPLVPVTIASSQISQTFTITTFQVTSSRVVSITATYGALKQTVSLTVNPRGVPALATLTIAPDHVIGVGSAQGTVTLTAPAILPTIVTLSSNPVIASVPGFVAVTQGQTSASFPITTSGVTGTVTIKASAAGVTQSAILTVQ